MPLLDTGREPGNARAAFPGFRPSGCRSHPARYARKSRTAPPAGPEYPALPAAAGPEYPAPPAAAGPEYPAPPAAAGPDYPAPPAAAAPDYPAPPAAAAPDPAAARPGWPNASARSAACRATGPGPVRAFTQPVPAAPAEPRHGFPARPMSPARPAPAPGIRLRAAALTATLEHRCRSRGRRATGPGQAAPPPGGPGRSGVPLRAPVLAPGRAWRTTARYPGETPACLASQAPGAPGRRPPNRGIPPFSGEDPGSGEFLVHPGVADH